MPDIATEPNLEVLAPTAFAAPLQELAKAYNDQTGKTLAFRWGPVAGLSPEAILNRMAAGDPAQAAILPRPVAARAAEAGSVRNGRIFELFITTIAAAVPASMPQPQLEEMEKLEAYLQTRHSIGVSNAASGQFVTGTILPGLKSGRHLQSLVRNFDHVGRAVASGTVDIGFQQAIELANIEGITVLRLPEAAQNPTAICLADLTPDSDGNLIDDFARFARCAAAAEIFSRFRLSQATA